MEMNEAKIKANLIRERKYFLLINQYFWDSIAWKAVYIEKLSMMHH